MLIVLWVDIMAYPVFYIIVGAFPIKPLQHAGSSGSNPTVGGVRGIVAML